MGNSSRKPVICWMETEPSSLTSVLDEVNKALPENGKFQYLMADYWNKQGIFQEYSAGIANLCQEDCINGSVFGKLAEVRWREVGAKLRLALIAKAGMDGFAPSWSYMTCDMNRCESCDERSVILWGTRYTDKHGWIEARIPRPLSYPGDVQYIKRGKKKEKIDYEHVRLFFVEYQDERGRIVIQRRRDMIAYIELPKGEDNAE